jgi:competence/damage-inducible protein CinA-like protein
MPSCEIITIGTELLLGEITDTNSRYMARALRDLGIDLYRKTTIGDNARRIAQAIQEALQRSDIIITTGGLGPTVDDPTREAVALAVGSQVEFRPELWEQIQRRFERFGRVPTENNKRQAYIPAGGIPVENAVGTAPAFFYETHDDKVIISLPGVPREMEHLLQNKVIPYLRQRFDLHGIIKARVLHTSGLGESVIDEMVGDLETHTNPTVGLAAHSGQVDIRITAKAPSEAEADMMIGELEATVRQRLGKAIYGADQETLEDAVASNLRAKGWRLAVTEYGLGGELLKRLATALSGSLAGGQILAELPEPEQRRTIVEEYQASCAAEAAIGVFLIPAGEKQDIFIVLITPAGSQEFARPYGGPPRSAPSWGVNHSLDILRSI